MLGILGAYALNDWNERRARLKDEISILEDVKEGLASDLEDVQGNIREYVKSVKSLEIILSTTKT